MEELDPTYQVNVPFNQGQDTAGPSFPVSNFALPAEYVDIIEESKKARGKKITELLSVENDNQLKTIELLFDETEKLYQDYLAISQNYFQKPSDESSNENTKYLWGRTLDVNKEYEDKYLESLDDLRSFEKKNKEGIFNRFFIS